MALKGKQRKVTNMLKYIVS